VLYAYAKATPSQISIINIKKEEAQRIDSHMIRSNSSDLAMAAA